MYNLNKEQQLCYQGSTHKDMNNNLHCYMFNKNGYKNSSYILINQNLNKTLTYNLCISEEMCIQYMFRNKVGKIVEQYLSDSAQFHMTCIC